jgi:hypothetical protein
VLLADPSVPGPEVDPVPVPELLSLPVLEPVVSEPD